MSEDRIVDMLGPAALYTVIIAIACTVSFPPSIIPIGLWIIYRSVTFEKRLMAFKERENFEKTQLETIREKKNQEYCLKRSKNIITNYTALIKDCEFGVIASIYALSKLYREQPPEYRKLIHSFPDRDTGFQLLERCAVAGLPIAQFEHGINLLSGANDNKSNCFLALRFLREAQSNGFNQASLEIKSVEEKIAQLNDLESLVSFFDLSGFSEARLYKNVFDLCESPPELLFIKSLVRKCGLIPSGNRLISKITKATEIFSAEPQYKILNFRADFLFNGRFVVEIDGRTYHENRFNEDRYRDQAMLSEGYIVIRFTANQIFSNVVSTIDSLKEIMNKHRPKR